MPKDEQKIFGVYIRVSTDQQYEHGDSVEMQENLAKELIRKENGVLYRVYIEGGVSASKTELKDRKVLLECLNDAKQGLFNNLIVYKRDRLARKTEDSLAIRSTLESAKCKIHFTATGEQQMDLNDPYSKLIENVYSSLAEIESAQISARVSDTMYDKAKRGEFSGGNVTYGYENKDGYLVPIESTIPIIREVEDMYLEGFGKYSIVKWLEGEEVRNKGRRHARAKKLKQHKRSSEKWTVDNINAILFNRTYSGYMEYERKTPDGDFERVCVKSEYIKPIRSEEKQKRIDMLREKKRQKTMPTRRYNTTFLLTGLLICSECGREYRSRTVTKSNGQRYSYYTCKGRHRRTVDICKSRSYKKEVLEQFVLEGAKQYLKHIVDSNVYEKVQQKLKKKDGKLEQQLKEVETQLIKAEKDFKAISRLLLDLNTEDDMYEMMRDMYQEQQKEVLLRLNNLKQSKQKIEEQLDVQIEETINFNKIIEELKGYEKIIDVAPIHVQKQALETLFNRLEIDKDGQISYSLTVDVRKDEKNVDVVQVGSAEEIGDGVMFYGGVGDTTPLKSITINSDESGLKIGYYEWLLDLVYVVSNSFYDFFVSKNPKLKSAEYFAEKTGLSIYMHKEYRLYKRIPSYENFQKIMYATGAQIDDYIKYIRQQGLQCNRALLETVLNDRNIIQRIARRNLVENYFRDTAY